MNVGLYASAEEIIGVWQSLQTTWDTARNSWKGADQYQFEREHIHEIRLVTNAYIVNLKRLAESVQRIMNEAP